MANETGNTYIAETITDRIEIPAANLIFKTMGSSNKVSTSDCDCDRQPQMWPPKPEILISRIATDSVEISTTNRAFSTASSSVKVSESDCDNDGHRKLAQRLQDTKIVANAAAIPFPGITHCRSCFYTLLSRSPWSKNAHLPLEFWPYLS